METLDLQQAADYLKIHPSTAQEMAASGKLPGAKIGRSWVFLQSELNSWLQSEIKRQTAERREPPAAAGIIKPKSRRKPLPQLPC